MTREKPAQTTLRQIDGPEAFAEAFSVSRETTERLAVYASVLVHWQKSTNLVAPSTIGEVWHRHFADSAQLVALAPEGARVWLDIGSGAGFPGLVVALLTMGSDIRVHLVESDTRKCAFLREVARQTGVPVDIHNARAENPATQARFGPVDVVSARAVAPLPRLLEVSQAYLVGGALGLFLKGREVAGELAAARQVWSFEAELRSSCTDPEGRVVVVRNLARTPEV
ncbi:MAG: 16S rRNA (guanine(527)-N(7))-methyltransferase RsmG [Hyphomicrobiaceae bacterium]